MKIYEFVYSGKEKGKGRSKYLELLMANYRKDNQIFLRVTKERRRGRVLRPQQGKL